MGKWKSDLEVQLSKGPESEVALSNSAFSGWNFSFLDIRSCPLKKTFKKMTKALKSLFFPKEDFLKHLKLSDKRKPLN